MGNAVVDNPLTGDLLASPLNQASEEKGELRSEIARRPLVLIIDDEEAIRQTLSQVLQDESFATILARDGQQGIDQVVAFNPDLVFLDIWMPGLDGIETLGRIKEIAPLTEVVVISGHATIANALEATKRGAFDFIEKPLDIDAITQVSKRALASRLEKQRTLSGEGRLGCDLESQKAGLRSCVLQPHQGVCSVGLKGRNFGQRTIRQSAILYGQGLHSGRKSGLILEPLPINSGIHFASTGGRMTVPAYIDFVDSTSYATTVRSGETRASTIEHLMSALHACRVSNLLVKCNGEVPILDGSAKHFCDLLGEVGIEEQGGDWFEVAPEHTIECSHQYGSLSSTGIRERIVLEPSDELRITYTLKYPEPIGTQVYHYDHVDQETYLQEIAPARTFGFMRDIARLQQAGLAAGGRLDNFIMIGDDGVVNTALRFPEELARHKILDILGDVFLLGRPIRAHVIAEMTGHSDNVSLLRSLKELLLNSER